MKNPITFIILLFVITGCNEREKQAQQEDEKHCEVHHQPLKMISGYLPDPSIMVSPGYGLLEFRAQFGDRYPHNRHPYLSLIQSDGWTEESTAEVCEECEKSYSQDFDAYLKIDEKKREDQYMEYIMKRRIEDKGGSMPSPQSEGSGELPKRKLLPPL